MDIDDVSPIFIAALLVMDILTLTTLYPNALQPRHGIFVKNRLQAMDKLDNFSRKVIAPVPQCKWIRKLTDRYKLYEDMPEHENQDGIDIYHPKYFTLPSMGLFDNASSMAKAAEDIIEDLYPGSDTFDVVDGQYLYPDGVAAYKVASNHNKPLILTARGSDVNHWMENKKARDQILEAIDYSSKVICVSDALKQALLTYGVPESKLTVIINGIDPENFNADIKPNPLREKYYLSVGNLIGLKGHHITLNAFAELSKKRLIIVGDGEQRRALKKQAKELGIQKRVQFIKHLDQKKLAEFYAGATATILMSSMEGMPNVVLESLATGTPVIACDVGGVSEVLNEDNGILLQGRDEYSLINAIDKIKSLNQSREQISDSVKQYRWTDVATRQLDIYKQDINS
ncbi:MAG: glycosyltransferase [Kordiimonadaceae bacterium]|nr:glycosyltransferase [Kordiimonadaceae bacterium]MBT6037400.1 glycosyltransferase [Kordiimonadaceae bacterium]MBT6329107.1 glycosyltransferase [Kordiimonadaceae bacterium]MBT7582621.1 glycosyltransferase [Kordiimonadaceae bacterium]